MRLTVTFTVWERIKQSVCLSVCLSENTYISYTRHYYSLQYAKNKHKLDLNGL